MLPIMLLQPNISAVEVMELVSDLRDAVGNATEEGVGQSPTALEVVDEGLRTVRRYLEENERFAEPGEDEEVCMVTCVSRYVRVQGGMQCILRLCPCLCRSYGRWWTYWMAYQTGLKVWYRTEVQSK